MAALQEGSPSSPSPTGCFCTAPPRMAAPMTGGKKYKCMTKIVLDSVDELLLIFMVNQRKRQSSKEAVEALRKEKVRTLMSMR